MIKKTKEKIKKHFKEVLRLKTSARSIAMGFATGSLIAILPTFGLGILVGLVVLSIFKKMNKISMFVSFAVWNPLILAFLYPIEYNIGNFILADYPATNFKFEIFNQFFVYTGRFLLGNLVVAILFSSLSYFVILYFVTKYKKKIHTT
jgi:uncharacterized protein